MPRGPAPGLAGPAGPGADHRRVSEAKAKRVVIEVAITFVSYGLLAVLLAFPGFKLAKEKVLLTASARMDL